ncbi:MAG: low molecular weight phosphotyrosine protein phosphatase [Bifidobacteriaceae bacterium]|jgi:protein-tyrosine phosphatase|nr:low molecular weight phosphotyrosine protein phosphatase [Bifidobacteriaceae bacterium]
MYTINAVCTGNICRSAMAEVILRDTISKRGLSDVIQVKSSGVSSEEHGHDIDRRAKKVLAEHGYNIPTDHFAHKITSQEIEDTDLFLPMTYSHYSRLISILPAAKRENSQIFMYRGFESKPISEPSASIDLIDPWYGTIADFEIAIEQIEASADAIIAFAEIEL